MSKRLRKYLVAGLALASLALVVTHNYYNPLFAVSRHEASAGSAAQDVPTKEESQTPENPSESTNSGAKLRYLLSRTGTKDYVRDTFVKTDLGDAPQSGTVLVAALLANDHGFGPRRSIEDFLLTLLRIDYDPQLMSLAFLCGTQDLYDKVFSYVENWLSTTAPAYRKVTLVRAPFLDSKFRTSEHSPRMQKARRRLIARARNFILFNSLQDEEYTLFLDADIVQMANDDFLKRFIASDKDIIVPRIQKGVEVDYDRNTWVGQRKVPSADQLKLMDTNQWQKFKFIPMDVPGKMVHLEDHVKSLGEKNADPALRDLDYLMELDSVGGAVLFVKSIIFKQGVIFPPTYIVGTTWERDEGYDGIETEGICYVAKVLGYKCWAMPNIVAHHAVG